MDHLLTKYTTRIIAPYILVGIAPAMIDDTIQNGIDVGLVLAVAFWIR